MGRLIAFEIFLFVLSSYIASMLLGAFYGTAVFTVMPWLIYELLLAGAAISGKFLLSAGIGGLFFCVANLLFIIDPKKEDARFANLWDIRKGRLLSGRGIILGIWRRRLLTTNDPGHVLVAAPTRSGKGVSLVVPNMLNWGESAIVIDIKSEVFEQTSGFRASKGHSIYRFAPQDETKQTHGFNPLDVIRYGTVFEIKDLNRLAASLFPFKEKADSMWRAESQDLFIGIALYLHQIGDRPKTLGEIYRFLTESPDLAKQLANIVKLDGNQLSQDVIGRFNNFIGKADKEQSGVKSSMHEVMKLWAEPLVDSAMSRHEIPFGDFRKKPCTLYICISFEDLITMAPVINFMLETALAALASKPFDAKQEYHILFLLDEFPALGRIDIIRKRISDLAGYGIRIMAIVQDLNQLADIYTENVMNTILSNSHVHVFFAVNDPRTAKYISDRAGKKTVKKRSRSSRTGAAVMEGETIGVTTERQPLLHPENVEALPGTNLLIKKTGTPFIKGKRLIWYKNKWFARCQMPAVTI